jgi:hypothetical protein
MTLYLTPYFSKSYKFNDTYLIPYFSKSHKFYDIVCHSLLITVNHVSSTSLPHSS